MVYKTDLCRIRLKSFNLSFVFREIINLSFYLEHTIIFHHFLSVFEVSGRQNRSVHETGRSLNLKVHIVGFRAVFLFGPSTFTRSDLRRTVLYIHGPEIE